MTALLWFRRDLRADDHAPFSAALAAHERVWCCFVFDRAILDPLRAGGLRADRRVDFIRRCLIELDEELRRRGGGLIVRCGDAREEIPRLAAELGAAAVFAGRDYDPAARARDAEVARRLEQDGCRFVDVKDQVIFDRDEVMTAASTPYSVFTPYRNAWLRRLQPADVDVRETPFGGGRLGRPPAAAAMPTLAELGFAPCDPGLPAGASGASALLESFVERMAAYAEARDYPAREGTSRLSAHLRFGTVSIRALVRIAHARALRGERGAACWLDELIWREFYQAILWHHPRVVDQAFKAAYDSIRWDDAPDLLAAWRDGRTGYPLVDAAMRQLFATGFMHNRLRMLTASFLCKDLGIDWRQGERWFAERLLDFDLAANNGGWQWAASTGCDAQPWFRIFNPVTQSEKFDPDGAFIRRWVPELARVPLHRLHAPWRMPPAEQAACRVVVGRDYPAPIVDHASARERTLARYGGARQAATLLSSPASR